MPSAPARRARLTDLAVPATVETDLREEQRAVTGQVVESREIRIESRRMLEVDVEADEIDEREIEILRRRIVHVGHERARVLGAHHRGEAAEEALDGGAAMPADD